MGKLSGAVIGALNMDQLRRALWAIDSYVEGRPEGYYLSAEQWDEILADVLE